MYFIHTNILISPIPIYIAIAIFKEMISTFKQNMFMQIHSHSLKRTDQIGQGWTGQSLCGPGRFSNTIRRCSENLGDSCKVVKRHKLVRYF